MKKGLISRTILIIIALLAGSLSAFGASVYAPQSVYKLWGNNSFTGEPCAIRLSADVNVNWNSSGPYEGTCGQLTDNFSIEVTGYILGPYTGTITFYTQTEGTGVIYITNPSTGIESNVANSSGAEASGTYSMTSGTYYPFRYRYVQTTGSASMYLKWSYTGRSKIVIPTGNYFHASKDCVMPSTFRDGFFDTSVWDGSDVGSISMSTGAHAAGTSLTLTASGNDIYSSQDSFHYVWQYVSATNFDVQYRVNTVANTDNWAKYGIMARSYDSTNFYDNKNFMVMASYGNNYAQQYRTTNGSTTSRGHRHRIRTKLYVKA